MQIYTIKDIAKLSGVGVSTVSRVLNGKPDVGEQTRQKVLEVVEKCNYSPNNNAKNLKQRETKNIATIIRGKSSAFLNSIIQEMTQASREYKQNFIFEYIDEEADEYQVAKQLVTEKKVEGLIFLGGCALSNYQAVSDLKIPCVYSTVSADGSSDKRISSVSINDYESGRKAIEHLISKGHKKIAIITSAPFSDDSIGRRYKGAISALKDNGIEFDEKYMIESNFSLNSAYKAVTNKKDILKEVTAIFALSDIMAMGASRAIVNEGYKIPEDISIMGFDGIEIGQYFIPTISTIKQPEQILASESIRLIVESIEADGLDQHVILNASLVEGESVKTIN